MEYRIDHALILFAAGVAAAIAVALSAIPAQLISRVDVQKVLQASAGNASAGRWTGRAQRLFVMAQVACAAVLLTGGGLMTATVLRLGKFDLGIPYEQLVYGSPSYPHAMRTEGTRLSVAHRARRFLRQCPLPRRGKCRLARVRAAAARRRDDDHARRRRDAARASSGARGGPVSANETYFETVGVAHSCADVFLRRSIGRRARPSRSLSETGRAALVAPGRMRSARSFASIRRRRNPP